jgi:hypothetical protein
MPLKTKLDQNWHALMALCVQERELREQGRHPKLLRHVSAAIDTLAGEMGFPPAKIRTRDFRARKDGDRIVAIDTT